jgi:hypothetical protein
MNKRVVGGTRIGPIVRHGSRRGSAARRRWPESAWSIAAQLRAIVEG